RRQDARAPRGAQSRQPREPAERVRPRDQVPGELRAGAAQQGRRHHRRRDRARAAADDRRADRPRRPRRRYAQAARLASPGTLTAPLISLYREMSLLETLAAISSSIETESTPPNSMHSSSRATENWTPTRGLTTPAEAITYFPPEA